MSPHIPAAVFWCLVVGALAITVLAVRQRLITATLRRRNAELEGDLRATVEEIQHLANVRLPALAESLQHHPVPVPGPLHERPPGSTLAESLQTVMDLFSGTMERAQARADQSARAALMSAMRALQGLANEQQLAITAMQERHDDPRVLRDLLEVDHTNSQFGRRAQVIAVLCGAWPGRQRTASTLEEVVRGATSRIRDYRRVRVHTKTDVAVIGRGVEPVVLAVAELLDNATRHSQPNTTVEVSVQPVHNGAVVVIDDGGVGMVQEQVRQAALLLTGKQSVDVTKLGDPPQFGFPVIGVLAQRYGFQVSVDSQSPYGGVRAVVFLPNALLTHAEYDSPSPVPAAAPTVPPAPARGWSDDHGTHHATAPHGTGRHDTGRHDTGQHRTPDHQAAGAWPSDGAREREAATGTRTPAQQPRQPERFQPPQPPVVGEPLPRTADGLPKRRRRQPVTDATAAQAAQPAPTAPRTRPAEQTAAVMGAFQRGTRSGRSSTDSGSDSAEPTPSDDRTAQPDARPDHEGNPHG
ncbi:sensor histidine kinase [Allostreptomyces psammosilenae]|uniref:histidine kinase n=1 Tax=Allostreptomyces psammosilenae TaxID=1892865 RepID=A0A853A1A8_9ACTN|nr:sensor histidine kinase [Allostreptomyces psammosilenae]NYI07230.1 hypothetical protein [Allostreptomyces psammosilenae]